jgi:rsbT co-antagonist protein RsbR
MTAALAASIVEELVRDLPVGVFVIKDGLFAWCNEYFRGLVERPMDALLGHGFVDLVAPEDRPFVVDRYRRRLAGEDVPDHYEFSIQGADPERRRPVHMIVRVILRDGERYSVGTVVDVTMQTELTAGLLPGIAGGRVATTPVLRVAAGVLVVPMVGHFHAGRVHNLTQDILHAIQRQQARALILDVTGLVDADRRVADYVARTAAAARLLGARSVLAGVSPELAQVLVASTEVLGNIASAASLEDALKMVQETA